jgi:hypothetical protein
MVFPTQVACVSATCNHVILMCYVCVVATGVHILALYACGNAIQAWDMSLLATRRWECGTLDCSLNDKPDHGSIVKSIKSIDYIF